MTNTDNTSPAYTWHWHWQSEPHVARPSSSTVASLSNRQAIGTSLARWQSVARVCTLPGPCLGPPTASLSLWSRLTLTCSYKHILEQATTLTIFFPFSFIHFRSLILRIIQYLDSFQSLGCLNFILKFEFFNKVENLNFILNVKIFKSDKLYESS